MDDFQIPDTFPADLSLPSSSVVPLFALPNVCLFPGTVIPLHIFEPRYKQMVEDMLDGPGRFALGTVLSGHERELRGTPPVHEIAGLGEIGKHERLPDGRFLILVLGLRRVRIQELDSDRLYRRVEATPLEEISPDVSDEGRLRRSLVQILGEQMDQELRSHPSEKKLPLDSLPLVQLIDLLTLHLRLGQAELLALFSEPDIGKRAEASLLAHREQKNAPPEEEDPQDDAREKEGDDEDATPD